MASMEELCDAMFKMVEADAGKVRYKPRDLEKAMKKECTITQRSNKSRILYCKLFHLRSLKSRKECLSASQ